MFQRFKNGFKLFVKTLAILPKYPILLIPLALACAVHIAIIFYAQYYFPKNLEFWPTFWLVFFLIYISSFSLCLACAGCLEMLEHMSIDKKINWPNFYKDIIKELPSLIVLAFIWAIIWIVLLIIEVLTSKKEERKKRESFSMGGFTKKIAGIDHEVNIGGVILDLIKKYVRMAALLTIPIITWKNKGVFSSIKEGLSIMFGNLAEFITGFALTEIGSIAIFFIPAFLIYLETESETITYSNTTWTILFVWIAIAWIITIYLEQMFVTLLFIYDQKKRGIMEKASPQIEKISEDFEDILFKKPSKK